MNELTTLLDSLIECSRKLTDTALALREVYSSSDTVQKEATEVLPAAKQPEQTTTEKKEKTYSKEDIRALLAAKAAENNGAYRIQVRSLVRKYGNGGSLTDIDAKDYAVLAAEVEAIGHA